MWISLSYIFRWKLRSTGSTYPEPYKVPCEEVTWKGEAGAEIMTTTI